MTLSDILFSFFCSLTLSLPFFLRSTFIPTFFLLLLCFISVWLGLCVFFLVHLLICLAVVCIVSSTFYRDCCWSLLIFFCLLCSLLHGLNNQWWEQTFADVVWRHFVYSLHLCVYFVFCLCFELPIKLFHKDFSWIVMVFFAGSLSLSFFLCLAASICLFPYAFYCCV